MSKIRDPRFLQTGVLLLAFAVFSASAQAPSAVTSRNRLQRPNFNNLYTTYYFNTGFKNANLVVCGSTQETEGCYGSADLGPFGHAGALIEGTRLVNPRTSTATTNIYVVDTAAGNGTSVVLYVYTKTDFVTPMYDTVTVTLTNSVALPLAGGTGAQAYMAADPGYLFIGTNQSPFAVRVQKSDLSVGEIGGFEPASNVSSITANQNGYVTVTFGSTGFYSYDPNGNTTEDGGGAEYMLSDSIGLSTTNLATLYASPAKRVHARFKKPARQGTAGN